MAKKPAQKKTAQKKTAQKKAAARKSTKLTDKKKSEIPMSGSSAESLLQTLQALMAESGGEMPPRTAVDDAQEIMYDAWEAPTRKKAVALARKALTISPDCADAYNLLAEETATSLDEAIELYTKGVEAGERALGEEGFEEFAGHFWGFLETRPYMRARFGLASSFWQAGKKEEAVEHFKAMLELNPDDNQGIRYILMPCLIETGRDEEAQALFEMYEEDGMANWMYARTLLDFRKQGDSRQARRSLDEAQETNPFVPDFLLGRRKMPREIPWSHGFGDESEAILYVHEGRSAWQATPGALEWLAEQDNVKDEAEDES